MEEVEIRFEREEISGLIPPGTYLYDAARRLGIEVECERAGLTDECAVQVLLGRELLSGYTKAENELLSEERRQNGERLACQVKIEKAGELTIMTKEKPKVEKEPTEAQKEEYRKEFEKLPLEKKIASLVELEAIALSETVTFILNSPYKIADMLVGVMANFGWQMDKEAKDAKKPSEHRAEENTNGEGKTDAEVKISENDEVVLEVENTDEVVVEINVEKESSEENTAGESASADKKEASE